MNGSSANALRLSWTLGYVPLKIENLLMGTEYLVFEANHDDHGTQFWQAQVSLDRIMGTYGHLSNEGFGKSLQRMVTETTKRIILAHLSVDCNSPDKAIAVVTEKSRKAGLRRK